MKKPFNFDKCLVYRYNDEYIALMTRKCVCGHSVTIYNRHRREICSNCGRFVFLTKKDEFEYRLKRKLV